MVASDTTTTTTAGGPIFFWREFEEPYGFLSQWYASTFTAPAGKSSSQMVFLTTEQYMMYHKAILFSDQDIADSIMLEPSPKKQQSLGRKVKNFDRKKWDTTKEQIVEDGNWWKMTQSKERDLGQMLLETGSRELVEVRACANREGCRGPDSPRCSRRCTELAETKLI